MSFFIYPQQFDARHVYFYPPTQNQITDNPESKFSRIVYSTPHISLNSVGFILHLTPSKPAYAKWVVSYEADHPQNADIISRLRGIECAIIDKYVHAISQSRHRSHALADHLSSGCIKAYEHHTDSLSGVDGIDRAAGDHSVPDGDSASQLIVTIYGIWETPAECGLIYKFAKW